MDEGAALWPRALQAGRATGVAAALAVFAVGLTLEDLRLFRFSLVYPALLASALAFGLVPVWSARHILDQAFVDRPKAPAVEVESAFVRRRGAMGLAAAAFVIWLALFASGFTPRW